MKGLILAGGRGTRLEPLTKITNKHLLPVYDRPMIFYALRTLRLAGIHEIMIITSGEHAGDFLQVLGSGEEFGVRFTFEIQDKPLGIGHAVGLAEKFSEKENLAVILGDNIFADDFSQELKSFKEGARVFLKKVPDPERFGVPRFKNEKIVEFIEKPKKAPCNYALTGLYVFDHLVFDFIRNLKPSLRGELEITEVNNYYLKTNKLSHSIVKDFWSDAGTFDSLIRSAKYVQKNLAKFK